MALTKYRMLCCVFGPSTDGVTLEWRRLQNEKIYDPFSSHYSDDQIRKRFTGACSTNGGQERCSVLVGGT